MSGEAVDDGGEDRCVCFDSCTCFVAHRECTMIDIKSRISPINGCKSISIDQYLTVSTSTDSAPHDNLSRTLNNFGKKGNNCF